jgi:hypothetical protein
MLTQLNLFNFYHRYKWDEISFAQFAALAANSVLAGFNPNGSSGLSVGYLAGVATDINGDLLVKAANGNVTVADNSWSLVVLRAVVTPTVPITRPTAPFDSVFLNSSQTTSVVALAGGVSSYPSPLASDVVLFGAQASGGAVNLIDQSQCNLYGKSLETKSVKVVGNHRDCDYIDLPTAIAASAAGAKLRVRDSATINATIACALNDINIEFDPGVIYTNGTAGTGFTLSGNGIKLLNGRLTGFTLGINITGNYCSILNTRFATNTTDVTDGPSTSSQVGVISE